MNKLKVWVVGRGIPSPQNQMLGSFEFEQARALSKEGVDVVYLAFSMRSAKNIHNLGLCITTESSIPVYSYNFPLGRVLPQTITDKVYEMLFSTISKRIVDQYGIPDVIHVHYPSQRTYEGLKELWEQGVCIVATEHWSKVQNKEIDAVSCRRLTAFMDNCDAFICVSSLLKHAVIELTGTLRDIVVIPNLVSSAFYSVPHETKGCFNYVVSGRLIESKQVDKIIRAFIDVFDKNDKVSLTIAGGGKQHKFLKTIIEKGSREKQIHLLGSVSREKMAEIIAASNALVTYSRTETFCVPIIEAWACGKPVIASKDIAVVIDNPDERLGITVDCNNIDDLKRALQYMRHHYDKYDAEFIRNYANYHFSEKAISEQLIAEYNKAIQNRAP